MAGHQIAKRIPLIKFPDRRAVAAARSAAAGSPPPAAGQSAPKSSAAPAASVASAGTTSSQPKRPKVSKEEIEAVLTVIVCSSVVSFNDAGCPSSPHGRKFARYLSQLCTEAMKSHCQDASYEMT